MYCARYFETLKVAKEKVRIIIRINAGKFSSFKYRRCKKKFLVQPLANKICRNECTFNCFYAFILIIQKFYSPKEEDAGRRSTKGHNL